MIGMERRAQKDLAAQLGGLHAKATRIGLGAGLGFDAVNGLFRG
jgi:hypothetical protein